MLLASAPIHIVLIRNNTISLVSKNVPQSVFYQIQCRGQAAAALCICSKQYINNYGYSAERQPRLVLAEHPKQELEHWKQSLGRHLPVADCTVLCTSPRGTAGVMLLCVVQRLKGVVAVMFHNVLFFRTEQGV